jgi:hypothetical protein
MTKTVRYISTIQLATSDPNYTEALRSSKMRTFEMEITPVQAREFLSKNLINRPLRPTWIRTLAGMIQRGEWLVTHQGIALTEDLWLLDGQHRLLAIEEAGIPVRMQVSLDCDPATFKVLDGGIRRSIGDQLGQHWLVIATARMLWQMPTYKGRIAPSTAQIEEVLEWAAPIIHEVIDTASLKAKYSNAMIMAPVVVHVMNGKRQVIPKLTALRNLDFNQMPSSLQALHRHSLDHKPGAGSERWDLAGRAWRAFDPANWRNSRTSIKDLDLPIAEMAKVLERFRAAAQLKG